MVVGRESIPAEWKEVRVERRWRRAYRDIACYYPRARGASPERRIGVSPVKARLERLDGRVLFLDLQSLAPVLDLAPTFLGHTDAKGPFTARDMRRFVLVEGDDPYYREVVRDESEADPYR